MYDFDYVRAGSVADAARALAKDEDAVLIAGGQTLIPTLKQRLAAPSRVIDISRIAALSGIRRMDDAVEVGAMTTHAEVAGSRSLCDALPGLAELAGTIGDPHVRHRGTLGGSLANNDPAADYPAACLALGATIATDRRTLPAAAFFTGLFETALEPGEIVTGVTFPVPPRMAYAKFRNPASRYAIVGVCAALTADGPRVAVTGAGAGGGFRWDAAEAALAARFEVKALEGVEMVADGLTSDLHAQADYRAHLIGVMTRRAVAAANAR